MPSEPTSPYRGIVALIAASHEGIHGRTRAQKLAYFARVVGASDFSRLKFEFHYSGPNSRQISDCLQSLVGSGLVDENQETGNEEKTQYIYCLTEDGKAWIDENRPEDFAKLEQLVSKLADASNPVLILAATARLLQQRGKNVDKDQALEKAVKRNPDCRRFQQEAKRLLGSLE